jgi:hypothetical protein
MNGPPNLIAMVGPLGLYFALLATWHLGRRPRVVTGRLDLILLWGALSGLLVFGPIGAVGTSVFANSSQSLLGVTMMALGMAVVASFVVAHWRRAKDRLVVYHADPQFVHASLQAVLHATAEHLGPHRAKFGQPGQGWSFVAEVHPWLGTAVIDAIGNYPRATGKRLKTFMEKELHPRVARSSRLGWVFFGLSALLLLAPWTAPYWTEPDVRAAFRALFQRLRVE